VRSLATIIWLNYNSSKTLNILLENLERVFNFDPPVSKCNLRYNLDLHDESLKTVKGFIRGSTALGRRF